MPEYLTLKQYSDITGRSLASVYRDAEKGFIKIALIDNKKHVIVEDPIELKKTNEKKSDYEKPVYENYEKEYQEAEIIENTPDIRYEIDIFKSSIATIEDMASRIEAAKNEMILHLKENNEKKDSTIDNLNEIIHSLSHDNQELRTRVSIIEAERK